MRGRILEQVLYWVFFIKNGPNPASFGLFSFFSPDKCSTNTINDKSVDGVLGTRTRGGRMVGADESTELWYYGTHLGTLLFVGFTYTYTAQLIARVRLNCGGCCKIIKKICCLPTPGLFYLFSVFSDNSRILQQVINAVSGAGIRTNYLLIVRSQGFWSQSLPWIGKLTDWFNPETLNKIRSDGPVTNDD